jgi:hypothetical protein
MMSTGDVRGYIPIRDSVHVGVRDSISSGQATTDLRGKRRLGRAGRGAGGREGTVSAQTGKLALDRLELVLGRGAANSERSEDLHLRDDLHGALALGPQKPQRDSNELRADPLGAGALEGVEVRGERCQPGFVEHAPSGRKCRRDFMYDGIEFDLTHAAPCRYG